MGGVEDPDQIGSCRIGCGWQAQKPFAYWAQGSSTIGKAKAVAGVGDSKKFGGYLAAGRRWCASSTQSVSEPADHDVQLGVGLVLLLKVGMTDHRRFA